MSQELQTDYLAGKTVYFLLRNSVGQVWNGTAFAAYATANYATYPITATEQGSASGYYTAAMPAVAAGVYYLVAKQQAGASPAETDITVGTGDIQWNGSVTLPLANIAASGVPVAVLSGNLSGQGLVTAASGAFAVVPSATLSGVVANSGLFVTVPPATISGVFPASGSLSGQLVSVFSGSLVLPSGGQVDLLSGRSVLVYSGQLSGQPTTAAQVLDKSGYVLGGAGLDFVWPESGAAANNASGVSARQMLAVVGAAAAGQCSGNRTGTMEFDAVAGSGTTRVSAVINASGNRAAVTVTLP